MKQNKKGNIAVITIIIVIVAITAGTIGWLFAKRTQTPIMQNQAKEENLPLTQQDKSLKYDIHFPDRYSGTGCYKKKLMEPRINMNLGRL